MKERPNCDMKGCTGKAFTIIGGKWVCGDCMLKMDNIIKEKIHRMMNGEAL